MKDNKDFLSSGQSAYARSVADFMVGINMSRLFSCLNPGHKLTVGRVQTPTLGLVVKRDMLIEGHVKQKYYTISVPIKTGAASENIICKYEPHPDDSILVDKKIIDKALAEARAKQISGKHFNSIEISKKIVKENPPLPFNLVKLQSYCDKKFSMSLKEVMETTQSLRDNYAAITYNRSDCQYLTENYYKEAPDTMDTVISNIGYRPKALDMSLKSACFNDKYVVNHPAIIPTNKSLKIGDFTPSEKKVYLAICQFYMAQFLPPATKEVTKLLIDLGDKGKITASSSVVLDPGYLAIFKDHKEEEPSVLSSIKEGTYEGDSLEAFTEEKETKPPQRYTQATLAEDMTCISKYVEDERIKKILKEKDKGSKEDNGSIGTVATRTPIICGLIENGFLKEDGKHLISTPLGRELYRILPDEIKGVDITAEWWLVCEDIVDKKASPADLQKSVLTTIKDIILRKDSFEKVKAEFEEVGKCPRCGGSVKETPFGFVCQNKDSGCNFVIWKKMKNEVFKYVTITDSQAKKLLSGDGITVNKLYSPKTQKTFAAKVYLDTENDNPQFGASYKIDFHPSLGKCPRCGKDVVQTPFGYVCSGKDEGCKFIIWKNPKSPLFKNVTFSATQVSAFLEGKPVKVKNLYSAKKDKTFEAYLTMDDSAKSDFGPSFNMSFDKPVQRSNTRKPVVRKNPR